MLISQRPSVFIPPLRHSRGSSTLLTQPPPENNPTWLPSHDTLVFSSIGSQTPYCYGYHLYGRVGRQWTHAGAFSYGGRSDWYGRHAVSQRLLRQAFLPHVEMMPLGQRKTGQTAGSCPTFPHRRVALKRRKPDHSVGCFRLSVWLAVLDYTTDALVVHRPHGVMSANLFYGFHPRNFI